MTATPETAYPHGSLVEQVHRVITTDQGVGPWVLAEAIVEVVTRRARESSDDARERARRLVDAEAEVVGLTAKVTHLTEQSAEHLYLRDVAEAVAAEVRDIYPVRAYVPGDAEPEYDRDRPLMLVGLHDGHVFRQYLGFGDAAWRDLALSHSVLGWQEVLEQGPCLDITGYGSQRLAAAVDEQRQRLDALRSIIWTLESEGLPDYLRREFDIERDRESPGSVAEALAVTRNVVRLVYKLTARARRAEPLSETTEETLARQGAEVDRARDVAVNVESELAALRLGLAAIHVPKMAGTGDPEEGVEICQACRTDWPCETRAVMDATDPAVTDLDEFTGQPDPF